MDQATFVIGASEAESMAKDAGLSVIQLLPTLVQSVKTLARPSISNYHVGAVGLGSDGRIFIGVNLEFPGLPLHHTVHAEQFLLTNLALHDCPKLLYLAVSASPCGHCRQFFLELRHAYQLQILVTGDTQDLVFEPLSFILPNAFGPSHLLDEDTPLLLEKHDNGLSLISKTSDEVGSNSHNLLNGNCVFSINKELELKIAALEAANSSHAPYSGCPSGVALLDCDGKIHKGSYVESDAYNPSLSPLQASLIAYIARGGDGYDRIVTAVLVEKEETLVKQEDTARLMLKTVSPKCELRVFHCASTSVQSKKNSS